MDLPEGEGDSNQYLKCGGGGLVFSTTGRQEHYIQKIDLPEGGGGE